MTPSTISNRTVVLSRAIGNILNFMSTSRYAQRQGEPTIDDFVLGNPHEMPLPQFTNALKNWSTPQNKDWFAYKMSIPETQQAVSDNLRRKLGIPFEPSDILMTTGAFSAIAASLAALLDPGDEVIYVSPPWFFYESMILANYGKPVRVPCDLQTFDLNLAAIRSAISSQTRAIIINTPNNPTGRIYPPETLKALSELLQEANQNNQRTIYLLADESYREIVYDKRKFFSPAGFYPDTFVIYTYGKTLLTPGQRIGYIALSPKMSDREAVYNAITVAQYVTTGFSYPNALLQYAIRDLQNVSIDVAHLQDRRDRFVKVLQEQGYQLKSPEGTFYLLVRSPLENDLAFCDLLADQDVFVLPGSVFEMPGYFRISLTANDEMVQHAIPGFARAIERARAYA